MRSASLLIGLALLVGAIGYAVMQSLKNEGEIRIVAQKLDDVAQRLEELRLSQIAIESAISATPKLLAGSGPEYTWLGVLAEGTYTCMVTFRNNYTLVEAIDLVEATTSRWLASDNRRPKYNYVERTQSFGVIAYGGESVSSRLLRAFAISDARSVQLKVGGSPGDDVPPGAVNVRVEAAPGADWTINCE